MKDVEGVLKEFFSRSRLPVLFAGAGVSARAGLPAWPEYLGSLAAVAFGYDNATKYLMDQAISDGALGDAATYYMMCRHIPEATKLKALAEPLTDFRDEALKALVGLPFNSVVTTNFDRALFAAYARHAGKSAQEVNIDDTSLEAAAFSEDLYIARIHGRIELPRTMRLSATALSELPRNQAYCRFLEHIFTRRQVVFIGFSFLDPAIEAVLRSVRESTKSMHGQEHLALVPENASGDFLRQLGVHSIRAVEYLSADRHKALWEGIEACAGSFEPGLKKPQNVREQPFAVAKKYLATVYARAKIGRQKEPLAQAVVEGIVSGVIQASGDNGISEAELVDQLSKDLSLPNAAAEKLVAQAVVSLARSGICRQIAEGEGLRCFSVNGGRNSYDAAIQRLVNGAVQRLVLIEQGSDSAVVRQFLAELFAQLLLTRGWDLGAAFAARKMPVDTNVAYVADRVSLNGVKHSQLLGIIRAVEGMLQRPDDEEAELLAELGRTAFGLELLLEGPHDPTFLQRTLPETIYFDANVLMPALTMGHPHYDVFNETIEALKEAAVGASVRVSLRIYDGFLNEIVSHRQLARESMEESGGEGALWAERAVGLYGSGNVNVFVGAYFNYRRGRPGISFDDFLRMAAPYKNEAELRRYLESKGFLIVRDSTAPKKDSAELLHALEKFYSNKLEASRKSAIVIKHDAAQLAILSAELAQGRRTMFVSADRGIRYALEYEGYSDVVNSMMTHLGLTQLVELLVGRLSSSRGFASLLWMSPVSDDTARIRSYLISLALNEHNAALAMGMSEVVDGITEDVSFELSRKNLRLDAESVADRAELNRTLEQYEANFFSRMNQEVERLRERGL